MDVGRTRSGNARFTGELFLTIGPDCNESQICGYYKKLTRDEVLAECEDADWLLLYVYRRVSGA